MPITRQFIRRFGALSYAFFATALLTSSPANANEVPINGKWAGYISNDGFEYGCEVQLARNGDGWSGTIHFSEWGRSRWPLDDIKASENRVQFLLRGENAVGSFAGSISDGKINGLYSWKGVAYKFSITRSRQSPEIVDRAQVPVGPFPYKEENVSFPQGNRKISGILDAPNDVKTHPAILLLAGTNPHLADPEVPGGIDISIFDWVIADALTRLGVVVLRLDDRGMGGTSGSKPNSSIDELADDAAAAVEYLASRAEVRTRRIGICGFSLGSTIAAAAAQRSHRISSVILLSPPAVPADVYGIEQRRRLALATRDATRELTVEENTKIAVGLARLKLLSDLTTTNLDEESILKEAYAWEKRQPPELQMPPERMRQMVADFSARLERDILHRDPRQFLRALSVPTLAVYGERDEVVLLDFNLREMQTALRIGQKQDNCVQLIPEAGHALRRMSTHIISLDANDIDPAVLKLICDWTVAHLLN